MRAALCLYPHGGAALLHHQLRLPDRFLRAGAAAHADVVLQTCLQQPQAPLRQFLPITVVHSRAARPQHHCLRVSAPAHEGRVRARVLACGPLLPHGAGRVDRDLLLPFVDLPIYGLRTGQLLALVEDNRDAVPTLLHQVLPYNFTSRILRTAFVQQRGQQFVAIRLSKIQRIDCNGVRQRTMQVEF